MPRRGSLRLIESIGCAETGTSMRVLPITRSLRKPMTRVSRRRGRPSTTPSRSTKQTASAGRFGCVTHGRRPLAMNARCESAFLRLDRALVRVEVGAPIQLVVLVARPFRKKSAERLDVRRDVLGAQTGRNAAIEESSRRVRRPVKAVGIGGKRLVFGGEPGPHLHHIEARLGCHLECEVQGFGCHRDTTA